MRHKYICALRQHFFSAQLHFNKEEKIRIAETRRKGKESVDAPRSWSWAQRRGQGNLLQRHPPRERQTQDHHRRMVRKPQKSRPTRGMIPWPPLCALAAPPCCCPGLRRSSQTRSTAGYEPFRRRCGRGPGGLPVVTGGPWVRPTELLAAQPLGLKEYGGY
jgi:hypothetical protein